MQHLQGKANTLGDALGSIKNRLRRNSPSRGSTRAQYGLAPSTNTSPGQGAQLQHLGHRAVQHQRDVVAHQQRTDRPARPLQHDGDSRAQMAPRLRSTRCTLLLLRTRLNPNTGPSGHGGDEQDESVADGQGGCGQRRVGTKIGGVVSLLPVVVLKASSLPRMTAEKSWPCDTGNRATGGAGRRPRWARWRPGGCDNTAAETP